MLMIRTESLATEAHMRPLVPCFVVRARMAGVGFTRATR
jgi:hypothetical protein